ncbi:hypothetical protein [Glutamicibacter mysorens]|uniref:hypothetical protein n=1 Tax=Glutamicibacter mysorens TaxID=257984 RepID=UPI0012ECE620|nr:hypothetical protein [Glutamicibacter mysorens]
MGFWPAVLILLGIQLLLNGCLPRWGPAITWAVYGLSMLAAMFGALFSLPPEAIKATPFGAIARVPAEDFTWGAPVVLLVAAPATGLLGMLRFTQRDIAV